MNIQYSCRYLGTEP